MADQDEIPQWHVTEPYLNLHCLLGEGPYFEKATNTLRFVDIKKKQVHTVSLSDGPDSLQTVQLDVPVTVTANVDGINPQDNILIGIKYGIALLDRKTGQYEYLAKFADGDDDSSARIRSNDGAADPHGRLWLGTMTDFGVGPFEPEGSLFKFDLFNKSASSLLATSKEAREATRTGLTIPNSIGWSPDQKTMYFTHSSDRQVLAWDYGADGSLSNERIFYQHPGAGEPDGFRVDTDGNVWHAVWGESRIIKISPAGKVIGQVNLPTRHITCCEFVGTELFITSAEDDEGEGDSKRYGGGLFRVDVGATGPAHYPVKLSA
ncbi:hypothetical protein B0T25DRAFT_157309 [Lasiosphaeria hispida]|uniref:SMP-30/Gluconolactonase/LRE-like region domain-containing protein n=1 Tax=Lasiosphaeria hispida TaxID=260671 RepID=A0AAJ0HM35_9PEZI|nr:hypothetical protein B0T25DRAFT_157309 [Lasiosphaeria hispida]